MFPEMKVSFLETENVFLETENLFPQTKLLFFIGLSNFMLDMIWHRDLV